MSAPSGLTPVAWMRKGGVFDSEVPGEPLVRLSDAEAAIALLRQDLEEAQAGYAIMSANAEARTADAADLAVRLVEALALNDDLRDGHAISTERVERDARRYQYIRSQKTSPGDIESMVHCYFGDELDATIDRAIQEGER